jgi:hypothetical protein
MKVLGNPIEGVTDWMTEVALVFASEAKGEAEALSRIGQLEAEAEDLASKIAAEQTELDELRQQLEQKEAELAEVRAKYNRFHFKAKGGLGMLGATGVGFAVVGTPALALLVLWAGILFWERTKRGKLLPPIQEEVDGMNERVSALDESVGAATNRTAEIVSEVASLQPQQGVEAIGRVYYPLVSADVAGYPVLIDGAGLEQAVELKIADLISDPQAIKKITGTMKNASGRPMLLEARDACGHEMDSLQGEESDLREAVDSFTDIVDSIPQLSTNVRLVPSTRGLVKEFSEGVDTVHDEDIPGLLLSAGDEEATQQSIEQITAVTQRMRSAGTDAAQLLRGTYDGLQTLLDDYREMRGDALEGLHRNFLDVVGQAEMTQVTYYCPRCNRLPEYLFRKLGIPLEEAHLMEPREVFQRLMDDKEVAARLSDDEEILREMDSSLQKLGEILRTVHRVESQMNSDTAAVGAGAELASVQQGARNLKALKHQKMEVLKNYRRWLRKAVTGSERPLLEISTQARLFLDPVHDTWSCAACKNVFDDPTTFEMGRMLKYREHLMMPMWNHLWTEKDDLRKQELFRSNEALQRMNEKESEKLINIGDQYRSDMRPVRENLIKAAAEAENKTVQLFDTIEGLAEIGLLSADDGDSARREIEDRLGGDLAQSKRHAEQKELLLTQEPQAQVRRRPDAVDPQKMFLTPESLFRRVPLGIRINVRPPEEHVSEIEGTNENPSLPLIEEASDE